MTGKIKLYYDLPDLSTSEANDMSIGKYLHIFSFILQKKQQKKQTNTNILSDYKAHIIWGT